MSDKQLLLQLQDHSQDALELLMQKYSPYLYTVITYILGRVGSPEDVEELMQDSFYAVWNHAENIHGNLKAYLRTTARNKAASWLRSHRELPMSFDYIEIPIDGNSLEDVILQEELSQYIQHALCRMGYAYKNGQDLSVRPPGKERFFRLRRNLGEQYSMPEIRKRLGRSLPARKQPAIVLPRKHYRLRGALPTHKKPHLRRLYLYYCYRLGVFQKHPQSSRKMHFLLREDLRHLDNYTQEIRLLHTYHLDTDVQLSAFLERREGEIKVLTRQRNRLYTQRHRETEPEKAAAIQLEIDRLTSEMKPLRREVRLCKQIQTRSIHMTETLEKIQTTTQDKEVQPHGYQRTSR